MEKIYKGFLTIGSYEEGDALYLENDPDWEPLAEHIEDDISNYGRYLSVSYYIANKKATEEELQKSYLSRIFGLGNATVYCSYSDLTGYLWTTERINVGGHDLLKELNDGVGQFLYLKIKYSKENNINKT